MLSVLIPTYNYDITQLVTTIHTQLLHTQCSFEILVFDDASDNQNIVLKNNRINSLKHCTHTILPHNIGREQTRNILAINAQYDWLLFLDADTLPVNSNFINNFITEISPERKLIFGGITYSKKEPNSDQKLRWLFGIKKETQSVQKRIKKPYLSINSGCLLIQKSLFIETNSDIKQNLYGLDILFSYKLKQKNTTVLHIDNPIYHNGLETNIIFLNKTRNSVKTIYKLEEKQLINNQYSTLQKSFNVLKSIRLVNFFYTILNPFIKNIESNLCSDNPKLILLDLYKLHYFIKLKTQNNA